MDAGEDLVHVALAGDTMLGRGVADRLSDDPTVPPLAAEVTDAAASANLFVVNLECCISDRGRRCADLHKPLLFRAPPVAAQRLSEIGVDAVTLANNHALDYGPDALPDTREHLRRAGGHRVRRRGARRAPRARYEPGALGAEAFARDKTSA